MIKNSPQTSYLHQRLLVQLLHVLRSHHELPVTNTQHINQTTIFIGSFVYR